MSSAESETGGKSHSPGAILPGSDAAKALDIDTGARRKKEKLPSPSERLEARVDTYIAELKQDTLQLQEEVYRLRIHEIHHIRDDSDGLKSWLPSSGKPWHASKLLMNGRSRSTGSPSRSSPLAGAS